MNLLGGIYLEAILLQYAWVLVVLIVLEGLLAADNAVVMAVMVKHLPRLQQKKALFYGLLGAFVSFCRIVHDHFSREHLANSSTWSSVSTVYFDKKYL